ncbi:MAG: enediyne biosynthesis protein [Actinomycetota bacterium]|nr:enediyne biosynthesis protein [Actinomycetota bacterium]
MAGEEEDRVLTLEAYADTIVPGEKRFPEDRAVAGASPGPGAVAAGALDLISWEATGITAGLPYLAQSLNDHAKSYAGEVELEIDTDVPPFVALPYEHRRALVTRLTKPGHPEKDGWVSLAMFCNMAFDSAAHLPTAQAIRDGHPGLLALGYKPPDEDGFWRFPKFSYGRKLAEPHPDTTPSGSPA